MCRLRAVLGIGRGLVRPTISSIQRNLHMVPWHIARHHICCVHLLRAWSIQAWAAPAQHGGPAPPGPSAFSGAASALPVRLACARLPAVDDT